MIHVPHGHVVSLIAKQRAGWLRARVTELAEGQPAYCASPNIKGLEAITIGGTVDVVNAELVTDEEIGISEGVPGQRFLLKRGPVVPGDDDPRARGGRRRRLGRVDVRAATSPPAAPTTSTS